MPEETSIHVELNKALLVVEEKYPDSRLHAELSKDLVVLKGSISQREEAVGILNMLSDALGPSYLIDASRLSVEGAVLALSDTLTGIDLKKVRQKDSHGSGE
jgi:hypothetical protein